MKQKQRENVAKEIVCYSLTFLAIALVVISLIHISIL